MPVETLSYTYTSQAEIESLYSSEGVSLRIDDLTGSALTNFWTEWIADATTIIRSYCEGTYSDEDLSISHWVRRRATWIAAYLMSQRRANPAQFQPRYEEIMEELERVRTGELTIPGVPMRADLSPSVDNLVIDDRMFLRKQRVQSGISAGGTSARLNNAYEYPYDWLWY